MVDFAKMTETLRAWKKRKALVGCDCVSEHPLLCMSHRSGHDTEYCRPCQCKCHGEITDVKG